MKDGDIEGTQAAGARRFDDIEDAQGLADRLNKAWEGQFFHSVRTETPKAQLEGMESESTV